MVRPRQILRFTAVVALTLAVGTLTVSRPSTSARAELAGNTAIEWNAIASTAIMSTAGQSPQAAVLSLAMVQGAVYDAVNAIDGGHQPYLGAPPARSGDSKEAAATAAAFRVLVGFREHVPSLPGLVPSQLSTLQPLYDASLATQPDGPAKTDGIAVGEAAAATMLTARAHDGRGGAFTFVPGTAPGQWRLGPPQGPTGIVARDPAPWVGFVTPFLVPNVDMLRSDGPNPLTSTAYAADFNEIKKLGSLTSTTRTADQTAAAIFWQDNGPAIWNRIYRVLATGHGLDIVDSARLFAMTNMAAADASIGCWNDKAYWSAWRPITAIREAASDGNPATEVDRTGCRCSTRQSPFPERRWSRPASPSTPPDTPASAAPQCTPCRSSSAPTKSRSPRSATSAPPHRARHEASTASRPRSRRSSTPASGAASTSAPPTCKEPCSATRSSTTW